MFRRYYSKGGSKLSFESNSVRVSNQILAFSNEVWEKCFGGAKRMALFFEEETNQIGLRGDSISGLAIGKAESGDYRVVRWAGFVKSIRFHYENPIIRKIFESGGLWVIEREMSMTSDKNQVADFQNAGNH